MGIGIITSYKHNKGQNVDLFGVNLIKRTLCSLKFMRCIMQKKEIEEYLTFLATKKRVSPRTQNQALRAQDGI